MALSLHAEYLLGYLAGARAMAPRDAALLGLAGSPDGNQARALLKALALGVADARRGRVLREAPEVRMHVLTLLSRETPGGSLAKLRSGADSVRPGAPDAALSHEDPTEPIEDFVREALDIV